MEKITADEIRCEFFKMLCEAPEDKSNEVYESYW